MHPSFFALALWERPPLSIHPRRGREAGCGIAEHGAVIDAQGFDPALLSEGERDEKSELNQLGNREVLVQFFP
jgi:hypothetical protein